MPVVPADVVELAGGVLLRLLDQRRLVETLTDRIRGPGNGRQVGKADPARLEGDEAGRELGHALSNCHSIRSPVAGHVAVEADPVDGTDRARLVVVVGGGKAGRHAREEELELVDLVTQLRQPIGELLAALLAPGDCNIHTLPLHASY